MAAYSATREKKEKIFKRIIIYFKENAMKKRIMALLLAALIGIKP